ARGQAGPAPQRRNDHPKGGREVYGAKRRVLPPWRGNELLWGARHALNESITQRSDRAPTRSTAASRVRWGPADRSRRRADRSARTARTSPRRTTTPARLGGSAASARPPP